MKEHKQKTETNNCTDLIIFKDEHDTISEIYVELLNTDNLIKFKTKGGNIISIPPTSVIKIKQRVANNE